MLKRNNRDGSGSQDSAQARYPDADGKPIAENTVQFELCADGLVVRYPNGEPFKDFGELARERDRAQQERDRALVKLKELGIDPDAL